MEELDTKSRQILCKLQIILDSLESVAEGTTRFEIIKQINNYFPELSKLKNPEYNLEKVDFCICKHPLFSYKNHGYCYYCNAPIKRK